VQQKTKERDKESMGRWVGHVGKWLGRDARRRSRLNIKQKPPTVYDMALQNIFSIVSDAHVAEVLILCIYLFSNNLMLVAAN
jgi:hypothetical protein